MLISTKGRYALRFMIDLAEHEQDGYVRLKDIAARQQISEKYLEAIVKALGKQKMIVALRGKGGGYRLAKSGRRVSGQDDSRMHGRLADARRLS